MSSLIFREAREEAEFAQIHALNHRVFAEEIRQHACHANGLLVDRFHAQSRYFVAIRQGAVIGMISLNAGPEFSVRKRLPDASLLDGLERPAEIRLLAIASELRHRTVLNGLLWQVYEHATDAGYSHLLISAITTREAMYRRLGFDALGPAVPEGDAAFIPMALALKEHGVVYARRVGLHRGRWMRTIENRRPLVEATAADETLSLLPGPVAIHRQIASAFMAAPLSHRAAECVERFEDVRRQLCRLVPGTETAIFPGGGTLANDAVAANLRAIFGDAPGLVLSNGEFGERLTRQAAAAGLRFRVLRFPCGEPWLLDTVRTALQERAAWVWAVHLETSTGVLNDACGLLGMAEDAGCAVALDCVSSLGAVEMSMSPAWMATSVSGKSLGAYTGLAFVFVNERCRRALEGRTLCPSFDLTQLLRTQGPTTTVGSPVLMALGAALNLHYQTETSASERFCEYAVLGSLVRGRLRAAGILPLAAEANAAPNITTFRLPCAAFAERCRRAGYQIAHESPYLQRERWGQIATMGDVQKESLAALFAELERARCEVAATV